MSAGSFVQATEHLERDCPGDCGWHQVVLAADGSRVHWSFEPVPRDPDDVAAEREEQEQAEVARQASTLSAPASLRLQAVAALATFEALLTRLHSTASGEAVTRALASSIDRARANCLDLIERLATEGYAADAIERQLETLRAERGAVERELGCLVPQGYLAQAVAAARAHVLEEGRDQTGRPRWLKAAALTDGEIEEVRARLSRAPCSVTEAELLATVDALRQELWSRAGAGGAA